MAVNIRELPKGPSSISSASSDSKDEQRLMSISRDARRVMVAYNREIIQSDLGENQAILERYEAASMALYRANESKSVNCHAIWGLHRRNTRLDTFRQKVLENKTLPYTYGMNQEEL